jgi:glyoxylase-like metal-dependent hydrolase (beta-lactamase superfamily II)
MEIRISAIEGNHQWLDGGAMFGNAPRAVWERWSPPDQLGRIKLSCRAMLVEAAGHKILCETGIGCFFDPKLAQRYGVEESEHMLLRNLQSLGISPDQITAVVLSHLHFDHAGGLLPSFAEIASGNDGLVFPRAQILVGAQAWNRALAPHPRDRASFIPGMCEKLTKSGRLVIVPQGDIQRHFDDIISFRFSDGHTPGQMHTVVHGSKLNFYFAGDLIPGIPWIHTSITMGYDRNAELVIDEKIQIYQEIAKPNYRAFFTHDAQHCAAEICLRPDGKFAAGEQLPADLIRMLV